MPDHTRTASEAGCLESQLLRHWDGVLRTDPYMPSGVWDSLDSGSLEQFSGSHSAHSEASSLRAHTASLTS